MSSDWFALVHTPVKNWNAIPDAKTAVDKEWDKLNDKKAWVLGSVREYQELSDNALKEGKTLHFGNLMRLCHVKHSELEKKFHSYKRESCFPRR